MVQWEINEQIHILKRPAVLWEFVRDMWWPKTHRSPTRPGVMETSTPNEYCPIILYILRKSKLLMWFKPYERLDRNLNYRRIQEKGRKGRGKLEWNRMWRVVLHIERCILSGRIESIRYSYHRAGCWLLCCSEKTNSTKKCLNVTSGQYRHRKRRQGAYHQLHCCSYINNKQGSRSKHRLLKGCDVTLMLRFWVQVEVWSRTKEDPDAPSFEMWTTSLCAKLS